MCVGYVSSLHQLRDTPYKPRPDACGCHSNPMHSDHMHSDLVGSDIMASKPTGSDSVGRGPDCPIPWGQTPSQLFRDLRASNFLFSSELPRLSPCPSRKTLLEEDADGFDDPIAPDIVKRILLFCLSFEPPQLPPVDGTFRKNG